MSRGMPASDIRTQDHIESEKNWMQKGESLSLVVVEVVGVLEYASNGICEEEGDGKEDEEVSEGHG